MALMAIAAEGSADSLSRPVLSAYTISVGDAHLTDTYLSPLRYTGQSLSLDYERRQAMRFDPERWSMRLSGRLEGMHTRNQARNATMWALNLHLEWGMTRRFTPLPRMSVGAGGSTSLTGGVLYNRRNGNNPVSAKCAWTVNLTGYCAYRLRLGSLPVTLTYQPTIPVAGVFFAPAYGELYYEIYMGNHSGLVHPAWWGNYFVMENLVTADLHFGATALRVGFRSNVLSTRHSDINTRIISNCLVVGVSGLSQSLDPRHCPPTIVY